MFQKVDVTLNIYGKPWQTLCTVKSLLQYSGKWIDKIYMTIEKHHPYDDDPRWILNHIDCVSYTPKDYFFTKGTWGDLNNQEERFVYRYQYGIEMSDKKHVFIAHNDILFTDDIIGHMLDRVGENAGIGLVGQCWNCSAFKAGMCDGERHDKVDYTYDEVVNMMTRFPMARHQIVNKEKPMPLPECRLNEFACLINREITMKECMPGGATPLFGSYDMLDLGDAWFRSLIDKGYKFVNYDINKDSSHGYFSNIEARVYEDAKMFFVSGYPTQLQENLYYDAESLAMNYHKENYED